MKKHKHNWRGERNADAWHMFTCKVCTICKAVKRRYNREGRKLIQGGWRSPV